MDENQSNVTAVTAQGLHGLRCTGYAALVAALEGLGATTAGESE